MDGGAQAPQAGAADRRLWLARHGQTAYNLEGRFQGWLPVPLDETGRRAGAPSSPRSSRAWRPRRSSAATSPAPARRPRSSARASASSRSSTRASPRPRPATGPTARSPTCIAEDPEGFARFAALDPDWGFPGGETFAEQRARVLEGIADWRARGHRRARRDRLPRQRDPAGDAHGRRRGRRPARQREPRRACDAAGAGRVRRARRQRVRGVLRRAAAQVVTVGRPGLQAQVPGGLAERRRAAGPPARDVPAQARRHRRRRDRQRAGRRRARARVRAPAGGLPPAAAEPRLGRARRRRGAPCRTAPTGCA